MTSFLTLLNSQQVLIELFDDCWRLIAPGDIVLIAYAPVRWHPTVPDGRSVKVVDHVEETDTFLRIVFVDGSGMHILLDDASQSAPEAVVMHLPDKTVVWA